jgi:hypothetical protein
MFGLLFGMCHSHHAIETRLHEERKACKKLQKDMKSRKLSILIRLLLLLAPKKERVTPYTF